MIGWTVLLAAASAGCAWTATPAGSSGRLRSAPPPTADFLRLRWLPVITVCGGGAGLWGLHTGAGPRLLGVVGAALTVTVVVRHLVAGSQRRGRRRGRQLAVIELCDALSAELRAGVPADRALERSLGARGEWAVIGAAARLGGDVGTAIVRGAGAPGAEGMHALAAGWRVASRTGSGLAEVVERVAAGLRADDDARCEVTASLGPPRATAKMLALLPAFGLLLGSSMGADPIGFLLHTALGACCLVLGLLLAGSGVLWVERLAASAEM